MKKNKNKYKVPKYRFGTKVRNTIDQFKTDWNEQRGNLLQDTGRAALDYVTSAWGLDVVPDSAYETQAFKNILPTMDAVNSVQRFAGRTIVPAAVGAATGNPMAAKAVGAGMDALSNISQEDDGLSQESVQSFARGGMSVPNAEVEGGEVLEYPSGRMKNINGPSHDQGGVQVSLPEGTKIFSDDPSMKTPEGKTIASVAKKLNKAKEKYESTLIGKNGIEKNTAAIMLKSIEKQINDLFSYQESLKNPSRGVSEQPQRTISPQMMQSTGDGLRASEGFKYGGKKKGVVPSTIPFVTPKETNVPETPQLSGISSIKSKGLSLPSNMSIGEGDTVITDMDNVYDYKISNGKYYSKKKNENTWLDWDIYLDDNSKKKAIQSVNTYLGISTPETTQAVVPTKVKPTISKSTPIVDHGTTLRPPVSSTISGTKIPAIERIATKPTWEGPLQEWNGFRYVPKPSASRPIVKNDNKEVDKGSPVVVPKIVSPTKKPITKRKNKVIPPVEMPGIYKEESSSNYVKPNPVEKIDNTKDTFTLRNNYINKKEGDVVKTKPTKYKEEQIETPNKGPIAPEYEGFKNMDKFVILHHTGGDDAKSTFTSDTSKVSSHVVIKKNGERDVYANPEEVTWHAGKSKWDGAKNINLYGIGVEFEGNTLKNPLTEKQIESFVEYIAPIIIKKKIAIEDIITHRMITKRDNGTSRKPDIVDSDYKRVITALKEKLYDKYNLKYKQVTNDELYSDFMKQYKSKYPSGYKLFDKPNFVERRPSF